MLKIKRPIAMEVSNWKGIDLEKTHEDLFCKHSFGLSPWGHDRFSEKVSKPIWDKENKELLTILAWDEEHQDLLIRVSTHTSIKYQIIRYCDANYNYHLYLWFFKIKNSLVNKIKKYLCLTTRVEFCKYVNHDQIVFNIELPKGLGFQPWKWEIRAYITLFKTTIRIVWHWHRCGF